MSDLRVVDGLIGKELSDVRAKFPNIVDPYHAYAIMRRGFDDTNVEINSVKSCLHSFWEAAKKDDTVSCQTWANRTTVFATRLIQDAIYLAALSQRVANDYKVKNMEADI